MIVYKVTKTENKCLDAGYPYYNSIEEAKEDLQDYINQHGYKIYKITIEEATE